MKFSLADYPGIAWTILTKPLELLLLQIVVEFP
jgi:hypothetical protein